MKIWMFVEGDWSCGKASPCLFAKKSDAEAYLVAYAKKYLPEVPKGWHPEVDDEHAKFQRETKRWKAGKRSREPEWPLCATLEEVEKMELLLSEATDSGSDDDWLELYDYVQSHAFEHDLVSRDDLVEVPLIVEETDGICADGAPVKMIGEHVNFHGNIRGE